MSIKISPKLLISKTKYNKIAYSETKRSIMHKIIINLERSEKIGANRRSKSKA